MSKSRTLFQQTLLQRFPHQTYLDRFSRAMHSTDASVYQMVPLGLVMPRSVEDVVALVQLCREHGVSITARGGGTSQAGQAVGHGVALDFSRHMNRLLEINGEERFVRVEPGLVLDELNALLRPHGLHLPLDLSTANRATIGGMVANNSAGTRSLIYGKTIDYVEELTVVLADATVVALRPLDEEALALKLKQDDREGEIYRTVHRLGREHAAEIERRYPKILRRVGGYNLDAFAPSKDPETKPWNLAHLMVGSEGTLGLTVEAKLRVVPLPESRVLCSIQFDDLLEAMSATPPILAHNPSAVELMDRFMLDMTKGKVQFEPLRDFIRGDPGAVLLVEFSGDGPEPLPRRIDQLETDLNAKRLGYHLHRAETRDAQARMWELRRAALGLTMAETGDAKAISFVEDTAVAPEKLRDYIENFQQILSKYETDAGFYAHASVGLLHIRPVINLKTADGVQRFEAIAKEVADLVLEFGGALSGEHGDGLVRAPFQEKMFGPELYGAFCRIKEAFDPANILNPGKIVRAPSLVSNLRYGPGYRTPEIDTTFDFSDFGGLLRAAEQCSGVGACRKTLTGTMCPSYMATRNERDSTRGRANALRLALSGQLDSAGLADAELRPVMELCLECKACKSECPTGVDMARLKSEFLHQHRQTHGTAMKDRLLAHMDRLSAWGSRLAPLSNWMGENGFVRWLTERWLGLDRRRTFPIFASRSFRSQRQKYHQASSERREKQQPVALFVDTFNNYYDPEHLVAASNLIQRLGGEVKLTPSVCCGRPLISKGFLNKAVAQAAATTQALLPLVDAGLPILFCEPSCYSAVVDDHPKLLRDRQQIEAKRVAAACRLCEEWVAERPLPILRSAPKKILLHAHCHQKALVDIKPLLKLLSSIPECEVVMLDSGCCGMAGSYGYEHYEISQKIGERRLFPAVREADSHTVVLTSGFSCRQQIQHFTGVESKSVVAFLEWLTS